MIPRFISKSWHRCLLDDLLTRYSTSINGNILDIGAKRRRYDTIFKGSISAVDIKANPDLGVGYANLEEQLAYADSTFDAILCVEVLQYLSELDFAIKEIYRVLKPGGVAILSVPFMYPEHGDNQRPTRSFISNKLAIFPKVTCHQLGNGFTIIIDILKRGINNLKLKPLKIILLAAIYPFILISRLFNFDQISSRAYSGLFFACYK